MLHKYMLIKFFSILGIGISSTCMAATSPTHSDLIELKHEESNQTLCEGPLHVNCPQGKIFGDITLMNFGENPSPDTRAAPLDVENEGSVTEASVEEVEYAPDVSHPLEDN